MYCLASFRIIHGPMPKKFILLSLRWEMPGRCMKDIIFCITLSPVMRFWSFTKTWRPQKVRKIRTLAPIAAPVEARIIVAQVFSSSPL